MSKEPNINTHYRTCNLCEEMCGIEITTKDKEIVSIRGDKDDTFSRGHICPKALGLKDIYDDKDRLQQPVKRTKNGWQKIAWEEAFDEVAKRLKEIQTKYGKDSVGVYTGNPMVHNYGSLLFAPQFIASLQTKNRFAATSVDQLAHHFTAYLMFGHQLLLPVPDIDRTDFFLILGGNPAVSNGSLMTAPDVANRLKAIKERGGKVVVVDPRRTETAKLANQHIFIRPATDVLLLLSLLQVIFAENLVRAGRLAEFTEGIAFIGEQVKEFTPAKVSAITGISANEIVDLARDFAAAKSAVCYGRMGVSTQEFGALCQWLINVLNIVTGNFDRAGGAMFTLPAFDPITAPEAIAPKGSYARWHSRVRKLPEFAGEFPVAVLGEEILTPGEGQIRAMVTIAGNPVLSTPNGQQLDKAFAGLKFMVAIDYYINETTKHADIILPPTSSLEHENYDLAFHILAIRNTAKFSPALFAPPKESRHDWEILLELQSRMQSDGLFNRLLTPLKKGLAMSQGPERLLDLGLRFGPYGDKLIPFSSGLSLHKLKNAPHGMDLGALQSCLPQRLANKDKRISLAPEPLVKDLARVKEKFFSSLPQPHQLLLIGRRHLRSNNSWLHNSLRLVKGRPLCTMLINPADAHRLNLQAGDQVSVSSRVGTIEIPIEISDEIMAGVVSIPHGWGHHREGVMLETARQHAGVSVNDLTDDMTVDELIGTAAFNATLVTVSPIKEPLKQSSKRELQPA